MITLDKSKPYLGLPVHPVGDMFPLMNPAQSSDLEKNILENGLIHPVILHEGVLVDGRNRLEVCEWRNIYKGPMSVEDWIWATNAKRRHWTDDQRLVAYVQFTAYKEQQVSVAVEKRAILAGRKGPAVWLRDGH